MPRRVSGRNVVSGSQRALVQKVLPVSARRMSLASEVRLPVVMIATERSGDALGQKVVFFKPDTLEKPSSLLGLYNAL